MKKIAIGCDPNASGLKAVVKQQLTDLGYEYEDYGSEDPIYANVAIKVAEQVAAGVHERGILICGTGIGMCITANKVHQKQQRQYHDTGVPGDGLGIGQKPRKNMDGVRICCRRALPGENTAYLRLRQGSI
jgi:hypothetical protein